MSADHELDAIARADQASPIEARKILAAEIEQLRASYEEARRLAIYHLKLRKEAETENARLRAVLAETLHGYEDTEYYEPEIVQRARDILAEGGQRPFSAREA